MHVASATVSWPSRGFTRGNSLGVGVLTIAKDAARRYGDLRSKTNLEYRITNLEFEILSLWIFRVGYSIFIVIAWSAREECAGNRTPRNPLHRISRTSVGDVRRHSRLLRLRRVPGPGQWRTFVMPFEAALPAYVTPSWSGTVSRHRGTYHSSPTS